MPFYDRVCVNNQCLHELIDLMEPVKLEVEPKCPKCGKSTERAWIGKPSSVIGDDIPGGIWIRHGLCNEDGSPRKYYSKSEIAAEAAARGLVNRVEHTVDPKSGSDKARHTVRWISAPVISEEERLRNWRAHEQKLNIEVRLDVTETESRE